MVNNLAKMKTKENQINNIYVTLHICYNDLSTLRCMKKIFVFVIPWRKIGEIYISKICSKKWINVKYYNN